MRKTFLLISIIFAFSVSLGAAGKPNVCVGILSDVHVNQANSTDIVIKALNYFRDADVDAVMIAGDMIECGMASQLQLFADTWYSVFPGDKGRNGKHVEKLFVYGNHELYGDTYKTVHKFYTDEQIKEQSINPRRAEVWEKCFHEKWAPIYHKKVKGYIFIGAHYNPKNIPGLEEYFASIESKFPKGKPVFYFQHAHPKLTCCGPLVWGQDDGKSTAVLAKYPNLIAFSGHSHTTVTDERDIWQGGFTSIGTGSLRYTCAVENDHENGRLADGEKSQMMRINMNDGHQGQIMRVYKDRIELERHDFAYDESLGTKVIPLDGSKPFNFEFREKNDAAPVFPAGTKISTWWKNGKDRAKNPVEQLWVKFGCAVATASTPRAYDYEVRIVNPVSGETVLSKKVYPVGVHLGDAKYSEKACFCVFSKDELPSDFKVEVVPMNSFGKAGKPLRSP